MTTRPSFQFYARDWLTCPELRRCSVAARGLWTDLLALAHFGEPYGHLASKGRPYDVAEIARLTGCGKAETGRLLAELERNGVCSRAEDGSIFSRRMVRDGTAATRRANGGELGAEHGKKGAEHGPKGGRPKSATAQQEGQKKPPFNPPSEPPLETSGKPPSEPPPSSATASSTTPTPTPPVGRGIGDVVGVIAGIDPANGVGESAVRAALERAGFEVRAGVRIPDRGDGREGVVDLHVVQPSCWIQADPGAEPRQKSLEKLRACAGERVLVLGSAVRGAIPTHRWPGITAAVGLGGACTPPTSAEPRAPVQLVAPDVPAWKRNGFASQAEWDEACELAKQPKPKLRELLAAQRAGGAA